MLVGVLIASALVPGRPLSAAAQAPAARRRRRRGAAQRQAPAVISPEVGADRRVTFRILAPDAQKVELRSPGDIPGIGGRGVAPPQLTKNADGVWERTFGPLPAGAYRYVFVVNGLTVVDSRNPTTSQTNTTVYSLAVVPGSDVFDTKNVPHGAVASIHYQSTALGGIRRMHVYTPPGYEMNRERYPVLYLLHGAGDVDDSWSSVGRAGFILDNLIAANKAKPMIVVMPAGHVNGAGAALGGVRFRPPPRGDAGSRVGTGSVRQRLHDRSDAVCREALPGVDGPPEPRDRGALDGREPDVEYRDSASGEVRLHRCLQLRDHQRRARRRAIGRPRHRSVKPGRSSTWLRSTTPPASAASTSSGSAPAKTTV